MEIFNYHPIEKYFVGVSKADPNPMREGEYLLPAFATTIAPPVCGPKQRAVWDGAQWVLVPDHVGEVWWLESAQYDDDNLVVIDFLGDPTERGLTNKRPPTRPEPLPVVTPQQIRKALTRFGLRTDFEAFVAGADQDMRDDWEWGASFSQGDPLFATAATALGQTAETMDQLFDLAKTL